MLWVSVKPAQGEAWEQVVESGGVIGRDSPCEIRLSGWRVAPVHARLLRSAGGVLLEDLGSLAGVRVDGRRVQGLHGPVGPGSVITIAAYELRVRMLADAATPSEASSDERLRPVPVLSDDVDPTHPSLRRFACSLDTGPAEGPSVSMATAGPGSESSPQARAAVGSARSAPPTASIPVAWRRRIHARLIETLDLRRQDVSSMSDEVLRRHASELIAQAVAELAGELPEGLDRLQLEREVLDEAVGLGPLEALLADDSVSEVMVNRHDEIYVERAGRLQRHPMQFTDDRAVLAVIERIVAPIGRRIDEASPMVDARLRDGSRVHAVIPPLAIKGPCITVRKFARRAFTASDLVRLGSLSAEMATFLQQCVGARLNLVVSGGTGSGKTTLLNILSNHIPLSERVITVEDAAELQLGHPHLVSLEARPANAEGKGAVGIRELVRNTLRMRPDRIVVGECRGPEALDMLQAMNTGHEGSLTTLHANTPRDALARLETLVLMAGMDLPLSAVREQIASAVDLIVQQTRLASGERVVTSITEVTGVESGTIQCQELFRFNGRGAGANPLLPPTRFSGCDTVPDCLDTLRSRGIEPDLAIFASRPGSMVTA